MFHKDRAKATVSLTELKHKQGAERMSRVMNAQQLFISEKRQIQIEGFQSIISMDNDKFELFCYSLLSNLAAYLQELPETRNSYFSNKGGFINHILSRCEAALKACRAYFVSDDGKPTKELSEQQQLWMYCLLSASLLRGIGKLYVDFIVDIFDTAGRHLGRWDPIAGSMTQQNAAFYDYDFDAPHHDTFKRRVTLSLATKLMPAAGLNWITEQKDVYAVWLALLDEDLRAAGTLGIILDKAEAIAINRFFNERAVEEYNKDIDAGKRFSSQFNMPDEKAGISGIGDIPAEGVEFLKWLSRMLGTARIMVNQAPLFSVPGGLLMSPDIFKLFIREHPQYKNWQNVQDAFLAMQLHTLGADGEAVQKFQNTKNNSLQSGVVLSAVGVVLPDTFKLVNINNGAVKNVSKAEFPSISQASTHMVANQKAAPTSVQTLSKSGQWVTPGSITQIDMSNKTN